MGSVLIYIITVCCESSIIIGYVWGIFHIHKARVIELVFEIFITGVKK